MYPLHSTFMTPAEIKELGQKMFEEISAVYELLTPEQMAAVQTAGRPGDAAASETETPGLGDHLALRRLLTYSQARFCRLNVVTPEELARGGWMSVEEARRSCRLFDSGPEDSKLIEEAIELNLLPIHDSPQGVVVEEARFAEWRDATAARLKAGRADTIQYGFHWVREEAA